MKSRKHIKTPIVSGLAAVLLSFGLWAAGLSLDQAVSKVKRDTGGKVLTASTVRRGNQDIHRIKVLMPKGRVRIIEVKGKKRGA